MIKRRAGQRRVDLAVDARPAALDPGDGPAEQRLGAGAQVIVGVLVHVEGERLGVLVRVADSQPAIGPLDQQQLRACPGRRGRLRRELSPARQLVGGVVAQRVAVGQRRGDLLGQRRRLHHLQPHPPDRSGLAAGQVLACHPGVRGPGAQHDQVAVVPGPGVVTDRARRDFGDLPAGQPLVRAGACGQVTAQRGQYPPGLDDRVEAAVKTAGEVAAQRRVDGADGGGVKQLEPPAVRVGPRRRLLEQAELDLIGGDRERARGSEAETGYRRAQFLPQLPRAQRQRELGTRPAAADPDQAEVPDAGPAGFGFALELGDLEPAPLRRERVHGAEDAAADNDHSLP